MLAAKSRSGHATPTKTTCAAATSIEQRQVAPVAGTAKSVDREFAGGRHVRAEFETQAQSAPIQPAPFDGPRGDATLCDEHASFQPAQMREIPSLVQRGIRAGLIGATQRVIWTVADNGWIYEGRQTNADTSEFHGYPVRESEPIAELVYQRFVAWVDEHGDSSARHAAMSCRQRYGFH